VECHDRDYLDAVREILLESGKEASTGHSMSGCYCNHVVGSHDVTVIRNSRSRVSGLVLLPHFIEHLLPELHHRYVM
jgi:hypothetical protein